MEVSSLYANSLILHRDHIEMRPSLSQYVSTINLFSFSITTNHASRASSGQSTLLLNLKSSQGELRQIMFYISFHILKDCFFWGGWIFSCNVYINMYLSDKYLPFRIWKFWIIKLMHSIECNFYWQCRYFFKEMFISHTLKN